MCVATSLSNETDTFQKNAVSRLLSKQRHGCKHLVDDIVNLTAKQVTPRVTWSHTGSLRITGRLWTPGAINTQGGFTALSLTPMASFGLALCLTSKEMWTLKIKEVLKHL